LTGDPEIRSVEKAGSEQILSDALDDEPFGFHGRRQAGGLPPEGVEQLVGEGPRELKGAADESVEGRDVGDGTRRGRPVWKRAGEDLSVVDERPPV
jgi:hypothetical protein